MLLRKLTRRIKIAGQLFFLVREDTIAVGARSKVGTAECVDCDGQKAVMVFRSQNIANICRERLATPNVAVATCNNAWEFVVILETMAKSGIKLVALDYEPPADEEDAMIETIETMDFVQLLRQTFGLGQQQFTMESIKFERGSAQ